MMRVLLSIITILLVAGGILAALLAFTNDGNIWLAVYAFSGAMASGFAASVLFALEQQLEATDRLRNDVLASLKKLQKS